MEKMFAYISDNYGATPYIISETNLLAEWEEMKTYPGYENLGNLKESFVVMNGETPTAYQDEDEEVVFIQIAPETIEYWQGINEMQEKGEDGEWRWVEIKIETKVEITRL